MSYKTKFWLFLYGNPNLLGSALGLLGLGLLFTGVIAKGWLFITLSLYALGWVAAWYFTPNQAAGLSASIRREDLEAELKELVAGTKDKLPARAGEILVAIQAQMLELIEKLKQGNPLFVEQAHNIEKTVRSYLPETLESYLALPPFYAKMHVIKAGKTAEGLLTEQLSKLEEGIQDLSRNLMEDDAQALLANGRFLDTKFGKSESFAV